MSAPCPRCGTTWPTRACRLATTSATCPFLALYGGRYQPISAPITEFFADAAAGTLPSYSYLDPAFFGTTQNDDHPHADIRRGQNLMGRIVQALIESPQWPSTLLIITYDEWGGFFDTVTPPRFPDLVDNPGGDDTNPDHAQAGFRVPTILVSPFTRGGRITGTVFEHSAIPRLLEWRFGLPSLTPRDAASNNLAGVLDFHRPDTRRPAIDVPADPGPDPCGAQLRTAALPVDDEGSTWADLAASDLLRGWPVGP